MESIVILNYLEKDIAKVIDLVRKNDSVVAMLDGDVYEIKNYLYPSELSNYTAILDLNVYTRVTTLVNDQTIKEKDVEGCRWAAAIMAFCQLAKINFYYSSSLQEYASLKGGLAAVTDFESFHRADNCEPQALVDFAVGKVKSLDLSSVADLGPPSNVPAASEFEKEIYEFRTSYIYVLKLALLDREPISQEDKMMLFMNWMECDYMLSAGALHFANILFSPSRKRKMLKKRTISDIKNVGWDLALVHTWRLRALEGRERSEPVLLFTGDKTIKCVAKRLATSDEEDFREYIVGPWKSHSQIGEKIYERAKQLNALVESRWADREPPSDEQLNKMTSEYELQLKP